MIYKTRLTASGKTDERAIEAPSEEWAARHAALAWMRSPVVDFVAYLKHTDHDGEYMVAHYQARAYGQRAAIEVKK